MDVVTSCKDKLSHFRLKELKDVLNQLRLPKHGRKQDLVDRILAVLSDEQAAMLCAKNITARDEVAKLVDDTYRKMQVAEASDLASKAEVCSDLSNARVKGEVPEDSSKVDIIVRCLCGSSLETDSMIQCQDPRCHIWEHVCCVVIPEIPMQSTLSLRESFYCEICRLTRADPFWTTVAHPLFPVKLTITNVPTDGSNPIQAVGRTFQITRAHKEMLAKQVYDVQAWCMLLNDKVQFRMQWPQYSDLQVNGVPVRAINRSGSQLLGANGRDDGPIITHCIKDGINKIALNACDARTFCFGVRLVKRRSLQQVLRMIPDEAKGEAFEEALARVHRCIGGRAGAGNDDADCHSDSDSDIEVVADFFTVNLRCPLSGSRIKVAGRFKPCAHMGCFDLEVFVELNQRSRKWQCPICLKNYSLEHLIVDPYFNCITSKMRRCDEDVTEIEVKPDGSWRVKFKNENELMELKDLAQWHSPDGLLCHLESEGNISTETRRQDGCRDDPTCLKLGIKKNRDGVWEVSKPNNMIPMSTIATDPIRGGRAAEFDAAVSMNADSDDRNQLTAGKNPEVIVLSDSDSETEGPCGASLQLHPSRMMIPYSEDPNRVIQRSSCLGLGNKEEDGLNMALWQLQPSQARGGPGIDLAAPDISLGMVSGVYAVAPDTSMAAGSTAHGSAGRSETDRNPQLLDCSSGREDPLLERLLPKGPDGATARADMRNRAANGSNGDEWISLRLGDGVCHDSPSAASANTVQPDQPREGALDNNTFKETSFFPIWL